MLTLRYSCCLVLVLLFTGATLAVEKSWVAGSGNWSEGTNWSPAGAPAAADTVNIVLSDGQDRTITYDYLGPAISIGPLTLDQTGAGDTSSILSMSANELTSNGGEIIGTAGRGTFNQSGGTNKLVMGALQIGAGVNSTGTYNLSGTGALMADANEIVGINGGIGYFAQSGGSNTIIGDLHALSLGSGGGTGYYNLSGGSLTTSVHQYIGETGTGHFTQTGGTNNVGSVLFIGRVAGSVGDYQLSGTAQLTSAFQTMVGDSGTGTFTQGDSSSHTANFLYIGNTYGALGSYTLSGGSLTVYSNEYVGVGAAGNGTNAGGTFTQTGGTHRVGNLNIGELDFSTGSYSLSNGALVSLFSATIGFLGTGSLSQTGGVHTANDLNIAVKAGSTGSYSLAGGTLNATSIYVGGSAPAAGGAGTLTISGSSTQANVSAGIKVYNTPGAGLALLGGTLNTTSINLGGVPSLFNWTSGTLNITTDVTWDSGAPAETTSRIFGTAVSLGLNKNLKVAGNEAIGGTGPFTLSVGSGTHAVSGDITVRAGGIFAATQSSVLSYNNFTLAGGAVQGTFHNVGNFVHQSGTVSAFFTNAGTVSFGSSLNLSGGLVNEATMTVGTGQTLIVSGNGFTNSGKFTLNGGTIDKGTSTIINTVNGTLTAHGTITPPVTNQGTLIVDGPLMAAITNTGIVQGAGTITSPSNSFANNAGGVVNATTPGGALAFTFAFSNNAGAVVNTGPTSTFSVGQTLSNSGQINLQGAGSRLSTGILTNNGVIQGFGTITSSLATSSTGVFRASGGELDFTATSISNPTQSTVQVMPGSTVAYLQGMGTNSGTISLVGGTFENTGKPLSNQGTINGYGTIRTSGLTNASGRVISIGGGDMEVFGSVSNFGTVNIQSGRTAYFFGNVSGAGTYTGTGTAVFLGNLTPGSPVGFASFGGNAVLTGGTALAIDLAGTTPGSQYDQLRVTGQLAIGGALSISLLGGFMPAVGSSFDLMDWGTLAGTFSSINLPTLATGQWDTSQLYNTGVLSVVPSPLAGDFNGDGTVDAADFVVWRKGLGTTYSQGDYDTWRANFGQTAGNGQSIHGDAVPEPGSGALVVFLTVIAGVGRARLAKLRVAALRCRN